MKERTHDVVENKGSKKLIVFQASAIKATASSFPSLCAILPLRLTAVTRFCYIRAGSVMRETAELGWKIV
jgi:hypothetical protein